MFLQTYYRTAIVLRQACFSADIVSYIAISPGHGQGNPNVSPYLVSVKRWDCGEGPVSPGERVPPMETPDRG